MPVGIRRNLGHAPHHYRRSEFDFFPSLNPVGLAREEAPERNLGTEECAGKEAALEIAPSMEDVLRAHAGGDVRSAFRTAAHFSAGSMRGLESVALV